MKRLLSHAALLLGLSSCFTVADMRAYGPEKPFHLVCGRPLKLPNANFWALNKYTGEIWSDDDVAALRLHAENATAYYQYEETAPESSAASMPPEFGLTCPTHAQAWPNAKPVLPSDAEAELFRRKEPCPAEQAQTEGRADPSLLAETGGKAPCETKQKYPWRVHVCARPPSVGDVREWAMTEDKKQNKLIVSEKAFADEVANAKIVFVFDDTAPPESVYWFVTDPSKLSCPNKPAPRPYDQVAGSGYLPMLATATSMADALVPAAPKKGDGKTTWSSGPDGKGPPLTFLEEVTRQMIIAGALATANTSGSLKNANGSRSGMPGGTNVGGFSFPPLQAGVAIIQVLSSIGLTPAKFINKVAEFAAKGQRTVINEVNQTTIKLADELIHDHGQFVMAESLRKAETILPYSIGEKFTKNLGGKLQAHKIFERRAFKILQMEGVEKAPSIILTDKEHQKISAALDAQWEIVKPKTKADFQKIYKSVYEQDYPHWLAAIESYLR